MSHKKRTDKNHFSPTFANKYWTSKKNGWHYQCYHYDQYKGEVVPANKGRKEWGREKELYTQKLEDALDKDLENDSAHLYKKLIDGIKLNADERMKWSQFVITQAIRTPTFFRYRDKIKELNDENFNYKESIIGCAGCPENRYVACRDWTILSAAKGDFFVRTDNPIYMNGFLENPTTSIFYPLTPKKCFVACSTAEVIPIWKEDRIPFPKQKTLQLEKGDAYRINFELIKSADSSIILSFDNDTDVIKSMSLDMLGAYPQIPFLIFNARNEIESLKKQEYLTKLMSNVDGKDYPPRKFPFKPFYGFEFSEGINPFSPFGVTDNQIE